LFLLLLLRGFDALSLGVGVAFVVLASRWFDELPLIPDAEP
jgi:hypothetical protein